MKSNITNSITERVLIGKAMKRIRLSKNLTSNYVASKLGYKDESTYCRIERGEVNIYESLVRGFCKLFDCNIIHFYKLAGIDVFESKIKTWSEFYTSLSDLPNKDAAELIEIANKINPNKT